MKKLIFSLFAIAAFMSMIFLGGDIPRAPDIARAAPGAGESRQSPPITDLKPLIALGIIQETRQWISPAIGKMILNSEPPRFEPIKELAGYTRAPRPHPRECI